jgi:hypothetical protein
MTPKEFVEKFISPNGRYNAENHDAAKTFNKKTGEGRWFIDGQFVKVLPYGEHKRISQVYRETILGVEVEFKSDFTRLVISAHQWAPSEAREFLCFRIGGDVAEWSNVREVAVG